MIAMLLSDECGQSVTPTDKQSESSLPKGVHEGAKNFIHGSFNIIISATVKM